MSGVCKQLKNYSDINFVYYQNIRMVHVVQMQMLFNFSSIFQFTKLFARALFFSCILVMLVCLLNAHFCTVGVDDECEWWGIFFYGARLPHILLKKKNTLGFEVHCQKYHGRR